MTLELEKFLALTYQPYTFKIKKTRYKEVYLFFRGTEPANFNDVWTDIGGIALALTLNN